MVFYKSLWLITKATKLLFNILITIVVNYTFNRFCIQFFFDSGNRIACLKEVSTAMEVVLGRDLLQEF